MADVIKETNTLTVENIFVDGDSRTITLKNPKSEITAEEITTLNTWMQTNNILIGDKAQGTFGRIRKVTRVTREDYQLDLNE